MFLVPKSDGGWRLCCDYRVLNSKLIHESYSIPAADQLFDQLGKAKIYSMHDMTWGYHQLRWADDSIPATAIRTHLGTFEFMVLNFGPTIAPSAWQRLVEYVLRPYLNVFCLIYIDDLIVFSNNEAEHIKHLDMVYRLLAKNHLYLRLSKCFFCQTRVKYLGWILEAGTLSADPEKIEALKNWPVPETKQELRSFIGFVNFYRRLIPKCSAMLAPLTDLTKGDVPNGLKSVWTDDHQRAFEEAKRVLTTAPVVSLVDMERPFILEPDASTQAVGGVLMQRDDDGNKHVIAYLSKRLGKGQLSYSAGKLELLALIVCLTHWRHYLLGCKELLIETDHEPLLALKTTKNPSRLLLRWLHFIQQFQFTLKHRPGTRMKADLLSRPHRGAAESSPIDIREDDNSDDLVPELHSAYCQRISENVDNIHCHQAHELYQYGFLQLRPETDQDYDIMQTLVRDIKTKLQTDDLFQRVQKTPDEFASRLVIREGLLFKKTRNPMALYIPDLPELRQTLLHDAHFSPAAGHFGYHRSIAKLQRYYYWPNMTKHMKDYIRQCPVCLRSKRSNLGQPVLAPHGIPHRAWEVLCVDEVTGFVSSEGHDAIWVFVDKLTKMCHFVPATKEGMTSEKLADLFFDNVFRLHGLPTKIISDRDPRFDNAFWRRLFERMGFCNNAQMTGIM